MLGECFILMKIQKQLMPMCKEKEGSCNASICWTTNIGGIQKHYAFTFVLGLNSNWKKVTDSGKCKMNTY